MKKSALLAVSALSLGLVGLSTFVPAVSAANVQSADATIKVNVLGTLGIGDKEGSFTTGSLDVNFGDLAANAEIKDNTAKTIVTTNNTGKSANLTIQGKDGKTAMYKDSDTAKEGTDAIKTIEDGKGIAAGTSAWGYSIDSNATFKAVPAEAENIDTVDSATTAHNTSISYGISTRRSAAK